MNDLLHRSLTLTSSVCERGAALEQFKHILFADGLVRAFNGVVHLQAKSGLDHEDPFAVSYDRLASALRSIEADDFVVTLKREFLVLKRGKLTVRVRKLPTDNVYHAALKAPPRADRFDASGGVQEALAAVAPFVSADVARPWSVAALIRGGYAWATNNLSLVRYPCKFEKEIRIPGAVVPLLLELSSIDWISKTDNVLMVGCGEALLSFPEAAGDWPDVAAFFKDAPKKLPEADPELAEAAKTAERFADRFVSLKDTSVESKVQTIESEYEVDLANGKGTYNARLFSLVAAHATHIDFGTYPKPVYFRADLMQGLMVGVPPEQATTTT